MLTLIHIGLFAWLFFLNYYYLCGLKGKHPSALGNFEEVMSIAEGKQIVVFLDYDGTLSPIVDDPDKAYMSDVVSAWHRTITTTTYIGGGFMIHH